MIKFIGKIGVGNKGWQVDHITKAIRMPVPYDKTGDEAGIHRLLKPVHSLWAML